MKKILLLAAMVVSTLAASAQVEQGFRFGINGGATFNTMSGINETKNLTGFRAGLVGEYNFSENFYLGTGLEYVGKGVKSDLIDGDLKFGYLQIPLNIGGRVSVSDNTYLFGQVGPYASYAVTKSDIDFYDGNYVKSNDFDWGFNAKVGVELSKFQIFAGYDFGMNETFKECDTKNRTISVGVGYMF